ncbi:MAG: hypothetical protein ACI4J1_03355 [Ruminiclostridium sp.]
MVLKIGELSIADITSAFNATEKARAESTQYSLTGKGYVDRFGGFRYYLEISLGITTRTRWETLKTALKELPVEVTFSAGSSTVTKNFHIDGELPQPFAFNDNGTDMVTDISFALEEI